MSYTIAELLDAIRTDMEPCMEFPCGTLIKFVTREGNLFMYADKFQKGIRADFVKSLSISTERRTDHTFCCPNCGRPDFSSGLCWECEDEFYYSDENNPEQLKYRNWRALLRHIGDAILTAIDQGMPLAGVRSAEIMLPYEGHRGWNSGKLFASQGSWRATQALAELTERLQYLTYGVTNEPVIPEIIEVEDSPDHEFRRQLGGRWQHKHDQFDFWHPMGRVHKV